MNVGLNIRTRIVSWCRVPATLIHKGKIIVDNHVHLKDVDSTRDDVGGNQNLQVLSDQFQKIMK